MFHPLLNVYIVFLVPIYLIYSQLESGKQAEKEEKTEKEEKAEKEEKIEKGEKRKIYYIKNIFAFSLQNE